VFLAVLPPSEPSQASDEASLGERLRQQDVSAFEELYDRHSRLIYALVLRIVQHSASAEEVAQDVFLQLWRNASQYDGARGAFLPWLVTMARNRALDHLRLKGERQRRREEQAEELPPVVCAPDFDAGLDQERRAAKVRGLLAALEPRQRRAIELAYFEGLSHSEIAAALEEPLGTVKSWIRNGLGKLRQGLEATA